LAIYLERQGIHLSPYTIRNILRRNGLTRRKRRKPLYLAFWAWETDEPFSLTQTDVKDIMDKKSLGTQIWDHLRKRRLPRYQWTTCDGITRLRFLAYSYRLNRTNGLAFLTLVLLWLRTHGIETFLTSKRIGGRNLEVIIRNISPRFQRDSSSP
jgi:hypothetical protein